MRWYVVFRRPNSGEAVKKPSRPSSAAQERPNDKKKEPDARERRRKEMMQNQVKTQTTELYSQAMSIRQFISKVKGSSQQSSRITRSYSGFHA